MSVKVHEAFSFDSFQDRLLFFDDFHGDQLNDEWRATGSAGGSAAVVDAQTGGIVRITTDGDTNDTYAIDWANIRSLLISKKVMMEARLKPSATGFINASLQLRFDGSNRITFGRTNEANWQIVCTDGGTPTSADSGVAFTAAYRIFRIECHTHGSSHVHFYIDGTETSNSPITTNIPDDAADVLQPYFYVKTTEDATKSMDIDYVYIRQER